MMRLLLSLLVCGLVLSTSVSTVQAQRKNGGYFSIGPSLGFCTYQGDLDDNGVDFWNLFATEPNNNVGNILNLIRPGLGFSVNYHFHPHMYASINLMQGWMAGSDARGQEIGRGGRNLSFRSPITEVSAQLVYEFFGSDRSYKFRPSWNPFIFAGVSVFSFNPATQADPGWTLDRNLPFFGQDPDRWYSLQPYGTEGQKTDPDKKPYALTQVAIPIGVGIEKKLTDRIDLTFEIGLRKTFTDYLDDVSGSAYANPRDFLNSGNLEGLFFSDRSSTVGFGDPSKVLAGENNGFRASDVRGNPNQQDWFAFTTFSLTYIVGKQDRCPRFKFK